MELVLEHLNIEEIISYVTANKVDMETLDLLSKVNGHIRTCNECREKVLSFETINDEIKKDIYEKGLDLNHISDLIKIKENISNERC